ncbi:MAG TPA: cupin domain-containing protein [Nocardioides sp.]|nr:cupin domain-containing protein [Nocardioides sp.]
MPSANLTTTPVAIDIPEVTGRYAPVEDYTVAFETFHTDADPAPFFVGLPDDRCQCPHWGVVTEGAITFRWSDRSETYTAGDAYYAAPGHLPHPSAGTSVVEFSPTAGLEATMAVIGANLERAGAGA